MINTKDITIIMPHYGANSDMCYSFNETLKSLKQTVPDIEILVAKNGSHACTCRRDIRVVTQGQCKAVNAAIATTNTEWVMITNDDMIYPEGWFEKFTYMDAIPACMSPKLVEPRQGAPTFDVFFAGGAGGDFTQHKPAWEAYAKEYGTKMYGLRTGFNFPVLIKRDLWDFVGGYDINYDPWGSNGDSDLQYKIMLSGVQPYQNMNAIVYHFGQTSGTFHPDNDSYRFRNYAYFKEKWGFERTDSGIWESNFEIPTREQGRIFNPKWEGRYGH